MHILNYNPTEVAVVAIDVDDPSWSLLVDRLMPGHDWQAIRDEGLRNEEELQSYFISRIEKFINAKGRQIIGWDEIIQGGFSPSTASCILRETTFAGLKALLMNCSSILV